MAELIILIAVIFIIVKALYNFIQYFANKRKYKTNVEQEQAFNEKRSRAWYGTCDNCGKTDGLHRFHGKKYCAVCHAKIKTEYDFSKEIQGVEMQLNKVLDESIRIHELKNNATLKAGYIVDGKTYSNYVSNESWVKFCKDMEINHPVAYDNYKNGDGKELDERRVGKNIYPPKMASFGSSSRFIYTLMKDDVEFKFEEQLPTTVGGIANLDGFKKTENGYVFVEAKCRELYSAKANIYGQKYKELYDFISKSNKTFVTVDTDLTKGKDYEMEAVFRYEDIEMKHFDLKQMISHFLGIGTAFLKGKHEDGEIHFIYLLFNPTKVIIENQKAKILIEEIYNDVCAICREIDFESLFEVVLEFLQKEKGLGKGKNISDIVKNFTFDLCDQHTFVNCVGNYN